MGFFSKYELEVAAGWRGAVAAGVGAAAGYVWHRTQTCYVTVPAQIILAVAIGALFGLRETYDAARLRESKVDYFCSEVGTTMKAWARTTSSLMIAILLWEGTRALESKRLAVVEAKAIQAAVEAAKLKK